MYRVLEILTAAEVEQCRQIAATAPFVDGRFTNPHNVAKKNEQLHDKAAYETTASCCRRRWRATRRCATSPFRR